MSLRLRAGSGTLLYKFLLIWGVSRYAKYVLGVEYNIMIRCDVVVCSRKGRETGGYWVAVGS
jgi:hypothetical protein